MVEEGNPVRVTPAPVLEEPPLRLFNVSQVEELSSYLPPEDHRNLPVSDLEMSTGLEPVRMGLKAPARGPLCIRHRRLMGIVLSELISFKPIIIGPMLLSSSLSGSRRINLDPKLPSSLEHGRPGGCRPHDLPDISRMLSLLSYRSVDCHLPRGVFLVAQVGIAPTSPNGVGL